MIEANSSETPEKMVMIPEQDLDDLGAFLGNTSLDNLRGIMSSLGEKKPSHTVLDTLVCTILASDLKKENGSTYIEKIIPPNQQSQEQKLFVDIVAGHIGHQISNILQEKIENRDTAVSGAILKAREAFIEDPEVIGLVNLLGKLEHYVSKDGISALKKALDDFDQFRTDTLEDAAELLPFVDESNQPTP
jgi:hypothetical protein